MKMNGFEQLLNSIYHEPEQWKIYDRCFKNEQKDLSICLWSGILYYAMYRNTQAYEKICSFSLIEKVRLAIAIKHHGKMKLKAIIEKE